MASFIYFYSLLVDLTLQPKKAAHNHWKKKKKKEKKLNGDLQKYKYLYLQQNKMLYVRKIFFQGTWELFRQHTRYKNGKQKNPKRRFKYFGIESPLYSIV